MTIISTFIPSYKSGVTVTPTAVSATSTVGEGSKSICLTNFSNVTIYVAVGKSGISASIADYPVLAQCQVTIGKFQDDTTVAYLTPTGTASLHIMSGEGF